MNGASPAFFLEKINSKSFTFVFGFVFGFLVRVRIWILVWVWFEVRILVLVSASDQVFQFEEGDYSANFSAKNTAYRPKAPSVVSAPL